MPNNADHSVAMVAVVDHPGYNYDGIPYQVVSAGQKFNVTPARAARLLAKGIAKLDVAAAEIAADTAEQLAEVRAAAIASAPAFDAAYDAKPEPVKVDKRTKAYKASKG